MEITVETRQGHTVIRPSGRLDLATAGSLRRRLASERAAGHRWLVVDLAGVGFVDTSGVGALVAGFKGARQDGGDLRLACPCAQARLVLRLTGLERVLGAYDTVEHALAA
jgi:anti-sigma B factor antagonist